jgi:geranylgeranyl diphosphate synthase type 3
MSSKRPENDRPLLAHPPLASRWGSSIDKILTDGPQWSEQDESHVLAPYDYLNANPGKGIRSQLVRTFNVWLQVPEAKTRLIEEAVLMLHTGSLMIDDIEDHSELRRGKPSAHMVYGTPMTLNSANYVYFVALDKIRSMASLSVAGHTPLQSDEQVSAMMLAEMMNLHRGQGMELYWRDNFLCPTEEEYVTMANNKTAGLFRIVVNLMLGQSTTLARYEDGGALIPLVNTLGLLFQIRDDYLNLRSGDYTENKGYCEDLSEGKFSFPLIHALVEGKRLSQENEYPSSSSVPMTSNDPDRRDEGVMIDDDEVPGTEHGDQTSRKVAADFSSSFNSTDVPTAISSYADFVAIVRSRPQDARRKRAVVDYMEQKTHTFRYTCQVMMRLDELVSAKLQQAEQVFANGQPNVHMRTYISIVRKGWYGMADCT